MKDINGKLRYDLVPHGAARAIAEVFTWIAGVGKYKDNDWQEPWDDDPDKVKQKAHYYGAVQRHLDSWWMRLEDEDAESRLHPLKHVLTNVAILLWLETH
jgi:hypothetical protein